MILKEIQIPPFLLQLESLRRRVPPEHESHTYIQEKLAREHAGYYGESQLLYGLSKLNFSNDLIYQLRLPYNNNYFQIDCLLMTPRFFLIIEAKNYRDLVEINEFNQVLHRDKVYQDPVLQCEEQKFQLEMWLQLNGYPPCPVETLVTMTNSQSILKTASSEYKEKVVTLPKLPSKIRELSQRYSNSVISLSEQKKLAMTMVNEHKDYVANVFSRFRLREEDLLSGIVCPDCGELGVKIIQRRFRCIKCQHSSSDAYSTVLKDYYLLGKLEISNREFRNFSGVRSQSTVRDLLARANLKKVGITKSSRYQLMYNYNRDFDYLKKRREKKLTPAL